jgi:hypothetical protein
MSLGRQKPEQETNSEEKIRISDGTQKSHAGGVLDLAYTSS